MVTKDILIQDEIFTLTNQKVMYWQREEALILSDWHIGKATHFNQHGIAIPSQTFLNDLHRMECIIDHFAPKKIIVVGDMIHAGMNTEMLQFAQWRKLFPSVEIILVKGNHDTNSRKLLLNGIVDSINDKLMLHSLSFVHDYNQNATTFQINGHIHPGILMKNKVSRVRLPCFFITESQLLLPAYSDFTGLNVRSVTKQGTAYIWTNEEIFGIRNS